MSIKTVSTESFHALDREMQQRFTELASIFDFAEAERRAIDSLNNVYNLAEKAKNLLDEDFDFEPKNAVLDAKEFATQQKNYEELFARYLALEAEVLMFLKTAGFHDGEQAVAHNTKNCALPAASINRLAETLDYCRTDNAANPIGFHTGGETPDGDSEDTGND
jgi:hypothetical protein